MAGTIPLSLSQQLDELGNVLAGGKLYLYQAGTVATPQNAYQDSALTLVLPHPIILDAGGRLPQFFLADGSIKVRLTDKHGNPQIVADGILVVGASSGGGGGSTVDPTTIWQTGDLKARYGTGVHTGFVRANGRTIGSSTSGASERANADTQSLFEYLWGADSGLAVSTGRGVSANADWTANKTIAIPDWRGRALAFLDDMGSSVAGRLTAGGFGTPSGATGLTLGDAGGSQFSTIVTANFPPYTPTGTFAGTPATITSTLTGTASVTSSGNFLQGGATDNFSSIAGSGQFDNLSKQTVSSTGTISGSGTASYTPAGTYTGAAQGGTSTPMIVVSPMKLATLYIKL